MTPDIVQALVKAIELKDLSTAAHTWRVVLYTRALGERFGLDHAALHRITIAAALHDLGKVEIPDEILQKPGALTAEEFEVIKTHAALGHERLLRMGEEDPLVLEFVRHHHERIDGLGYPDGLRGDAIAPGPRFFAVIDSFDAMTSVRPYRAQVGHDAAERAMEQLHAGIGTRYCAESVESFDALYRGGSLGWILEYFNDQNQVPDYTGGESAEHVIQQRKGAP